MSENIGVYLIHWETVIPRKLYIYYSTSDYFLLLTDIGNLKFLTQEIGSNENDVVMGSTSVFFFSLFFSKYPLFFFLSLKKSLVLPSAQSTHVTPIEI